MKATRISLIAALIAGVLAAYTPMSHAQDAKDAKETPKREGRPGGPNGPGGPRPEAAKERLNRMTEELKLTDEQKTKVEALLKDQQEKMRGFRDSATTPEERREKMKSIREEMSKKMKEILTPEQFAKWEKLPQGRGPGGPGGPRPGRPGAPAGDNKPAETEKKAQ